MVNKDLKRRILEISYKHKLAHIGSCLTAVDIIDSIFAKKKESDIFVLSSGHAGVALYSVIEKYYGLNAEEIFRHHGVHPDRCMKCHIDCSSGSLGHGFGIAVGMAIADRYKKVYCLVSDGEVAEGSIYEALNIAKIADINNLEVHINCNGWSAYRKVYDYQIADVVSPYRNIDVVLHKTHNEWSVIKGLDAHYHILTEEEYQEGLEFYKLRPKDIYNLQYA